MRLAVLALGCVAALAAPVAAAPFVPSADGVVVERLPESRDPAMVAIKKLRAAQRRSPQDLRLATIYARRAIDAARATGDPRPLGHAQAALGPWWNAADAPAPAMLLRATIKQSLHDFGGALADLDRLLAASPGDAQARLTRASVRAVVGRHDEARADCERLRGVASPLVVAACAAGADAATGRAAGTEASLVRALAAGTAEPPTVRVWALTLAGEMAARRGDGAAAEARFRDALSLDAGDVYLIGAYADWLIDVGRHADAIRLLEPRARVDALLLRLVIAGAKSPVRAARHEEDRAELAARVDATRRRGDTVHRREEARYALFVEGDAARAVALARANFALQKEPADLRVLLEAANAANDAAALAIARDWIARTGFVDARAGRERVSA